MNKTLDKLYEDYGFPGLAKFKIIGRENGYSYKQIKEFLMKNNVNQIHKTARTQKRRFYVPSSKKEFMGDLLDMSKYSKSNKGNNWILIIVNTYTRYGYAQPLKRKTPNNVLEALEKMGIDEMMQAFVSDNGKEFMGKFNEYLDEEDIVHITNEIGDHNHLGIIDNFSKRVKTALHKYMTATNSTKWINYLQRFIEHYNETEHSSILNFKPKDALKGDNKYFLGQYYIDKQSYNNSLKKKEYKVGDWVRVKNIKRGITTKGYEQNYSTQLYEIMQINMAMQR